MKINNIPRITVQTMKSITLTLLITFFAFSIKAQNTFPSSGNVGIGTSSPFYSLDAYGTMVFRNTTYFFGTAYAKDVANSQYLHFKAVGGKGYVGMNSTNALILQSNGGKVGIGTSDPTVFHPNNNQLVIGTGNGHQGLTIYSDPNSQARIAFTDVAQSSQEGMLAYDFLNGQMTFKVNHAERLRIDNSGNVGIGTTTPDAKLTVKGDIHAEEVTVDLSVPGPDYVFEEDYDLTTLEETENYIKANKHLPEIPSAKEMEDGGINLGEMNMLLLKKVEELTLHSIQQEKSIQQLQAVNSAEGPPFREAVGNEGVNMLLLKKVEKLTLHVIELNRKSEIQHRNIEELRSSIDK